MPGSLSLGLPEYLSCFSHYTWFPWDWKTTHFRAASFFRLIIICFFLSVNRNKINRNLTQNLICYSQSHMQKDLFMMWRGNYVFSPYYVTLFYFILYSHYEIFQHWASSWQHYTPLNGNMGMKGTYYYPKWGILGRRLNDMNKMKWKGDLYFPLISEAFCCFLQSAS